MKLKKAAMFGLDARIALAIFGALSVISGAALYSAIQDSKVTSIITQLDNLGKAYESYYLDTGLELDIVQSGVWLDIPQLVTSTENGWQGPYFNAEVTSTHTLAYPGHSSYLLAAMFDKDWTAATQAAWDQAKCGTGSLGGECYVWVGFNDVDLDFRNQIDLEIDGAVDGATGRVRHFRSSGLNNYTFIKYMPIKKY